MVSIENYQSKSVNLFAVDVDTVTRLIYIVNRNRQNLTNKTMERNKAWPSNKIRGRLLEAGNYTYSKIAKLCSDNPDKPACSRQMVEKVINGKIISDRGITAYIVRKQISKILEKDFEEIWGVRDRFEYFGEHIKRV